MAPGHEQQGDAWWRRWWRDKPATVIVALVAAVGVIAAVVIVLATRLSGSGEPVAVSTITAPSVTVTIDPPSPSADPLDRGEGSALYQAIPATSGSFVLTALAADPAPVDQADALEAWTATYSGPDPAGDTVTVTVSVAQWPDAEQAAAYADTYEPPAGSSAITGSSQAADGSGAVSDYRIDILTNSTSFAQWTNGTVVLRASGPWDVIESFYRAYSM